MSIIDPHVSGKQASPCCQDGQLDVLVLYIVVPTNSVLRSNIFHRRLNTTSSAIRTPLKSITTQRRFELKVPSYNYTADALARIQKSMLLYKYGRIVSL